MAMTERTSGTHPLACVLLVAIAVLVPVTAPLAAQGTAEGTITGTVVDESKAILPGVVVTISNPATGFTREVISTATGTFRLAGLAPGSYELAAVLTGFSPYRQTITVTVGADITLTIPLSVAALQETLTVTGEAPLVEVARTEQGTTLSENEVRNLPVNSRDFTDFALLAPGVIAAREGGAGPSQGAGGFSTSGQRGGQNAMNIDGMANKSYDGNSEAGNFSQEAVQEFQVLTQSFPAEFGHATGGVVNAVTKSGTNRFSGYGFYFLRHNAFDKPPFDLQTATDGTVTAVAAEEADEFKRQVVGFTIGGPILRDKAFFFGVIENETSSVPRVRTILPATLDTVRQIAIADLPDNDSNRVGQHEPTSFKASTKVDVNLSQAHTVSARVSYADNFTPAGTGNGRSSMTLGSQSDTKYLLASGSVNSFLSQRVLNTLRVNFNRDSNTASWPHRGGIENFHGMHPGIIIAGGSGGNFGAGASAALSPRLVETKQELQNSLGLFFGAHDLKMGAYYQRVPFYQSFMFYVLGEWQFSDINAFRAGRPSGFRQGFGPAATYLVTNMYAGYAQDEWKPTNNLTVNYGLRYELNTRSDVSSFELPEPAFNPTTGRFEVSQNGSAHIKRFEPDKNNLMPRFGLSYTPDAGRTVLRGGGGIFYGMHQMSALSQAVMWTGAEYGQFVFTSAEASQLWPALRDPANPLYNGGILRLSPQTIASYRAEGRPVTQQTYQSNIDEPRSYQASAGIERQLTSWLSAQGTFLWSTGKYNVRNANINLKGPGFFPQGSRLPSGVTAPYDVTAAVGPRPDPTREEFSSYLLFGTIDYKGLSAALQARWPGLSLRASYSRNITWDDAVSTSSRLQPAFQVDPACANFGSECEWSESILSTAHRLSMSAVYQTPAQLPFYARDWQVSAIAGIESGHPYVVQSGFDFNNDAVLTDRPIGVPRTALWADGFANLDLRVSRFIPFGGPRRLEVIFEAFNVLNTPHYTSYVDTLYVFNNAQQQYVPRPDFAAFHNSGELNERDLNRSWRDIGLDAKQRRNDVGSPFQGQLAFRLHF